MKKIYMKHFFAAALLVLVIASCEDKDYKNGLIQSVDNQGHDENIISTAVTATGNAEFIALSVNALTKDSSIQLIPVVLTAKNGASEDIHVTMVPNLDSLASYDTANQIKYIMPGAPGTPAFTLENGGIVTIKKGSNVGYLSITTVTNDYFGANVYAFSYKIGSVQEPGYTISGNHNFGIAAVIPKNAYDGVYFYGPGVVKRYTGGTQNPPSDLLQGSFDQLDDAPLVTTGQYTLSFVPLWADDSGAVGGIAGTTITIDKTAQPDGTFLVTMSSPSAAGGMHNTPGGKNYYDPTTKTFYLDFYWGTANQRSIQTQLKYEGPR